MKVGTKSVLFGAHSVIHPFYVGLAWRKLFGIPWDPRLWLAFALHDIGYISSPNLEGPEGERHVELGARHHDPSVRSGVGRPLRRPLPPLGEALRKTGFASMLRGQAGVRADAGLALPAHDPCYRRVCTSTCRSRATVRPARPALQPRSRPASPPTTPQPG